ncbi:hypothetical protein Tco_1106130 [Tanacetum coccineum]
MVISSPCLTDTKNWLVQSKRLWVINAPCYCNKALTSPVQTATGKDTSNPLMAGSLPKTAKPTMDDPNITMEEYIRLEEEKARKCGKVFNWETAKYGKIWYDEDIHDLKFFETKFPAISFNYGVSSEKTLLVNPW